LYNARRPNRAMEPTARRRTIQLSMILTRQSQRRAPSLAAPHLGLVRSMVLRLARTFALLVAVSYPLVASDKTDYGTELKRQVTQDRGHIGYSCHTGTSIWAQRKSV
jgi:hypothetical protein